jgi:hypothetical protein
VQADATGDPVSHELGEVSCREDPAELAFGYSDPVGKLLPGKRLARLEPLEHPLERCGWQPRMRHWSLLRCWARNAPVGRRPERRA